MKILLLVSGDVSTYYSAALTQRGHQVIAVGGGDFENPAAFMPPIEDYIKCDGCLLCSDDPRMIKIADHFAGAGKPVWRSLADVPRGKMGHATLLYLLIPLFLMVVGALVFNQPWFREKAKPVAIENKPSAIATETKAPLVDDRVNDARPKPDDASGKPSLTPDCEKELRRTADLLRFFANRIQAGEEIQSVVADMRQQEKRIATVCPDLSDR
jgi:hypothetical protein